MIKYAVVEGRTPDGTRVGIGMTAPAEAEDWHLSMIREAAEERIKNQYPDVGELEMAPDWTAVSEWMIT